MGAHRSDLGATSDRRRPTIGCPRACGARRAGKWSSYEIEIVLLTNWAQKFEEGYIFVEEDGRCGESDIGRPDRRPVARSVARCGGRPGSRLGGPADGCAEYKNTSEMSSAYAAPVLGKSSSTDTAV